MPAEEKELKARIRESGLSVKVVADSIGRPYGTVANWLNGFAPLPCDIRRTIHKIINEHKSSGRAA